MRSSTDIPECWGMHGVHRSGKMDLAASRLRREEEKDPTSLYAQELRGMLARDDVFEKGGVRILRPLLGFTKERLIQTCRARALAWEEDKTNKDTWRTPRNSIRALLYSSKLPQALQKTSMLQMAKQISDVMHKYYTSAARILSCCEILLFDARCGGLIVRFPIRISQSRPSGGGKGWAVHMGKCRVTAMVLLQRLVETITPYEEVSLQSLKRAAEAIFPETVEANRELQPTSFTGSGVQFQRLHSPRPTPLSELNPAIAGTRQDLDPFCVWKLTRQPFSRAPLSLTVSPSTNRESTIGDDASPSWSSWQLWDGRYWIRLLNCSTQTLIVRSFQVSDLRHLRSTLGPQRYKEFNKYLSLAAPDKLRWTLPAIAELGDEALSTGRVLALPTLGQAGNFDTGDKNETKKVEWQIRYKSVQLGYQISEDGVGKIMRNRSLVTSWND